MKPRNISLAVISLLLVILLSLPWGVGQLFEKQYLQMLQDKAKENGYTLSVKHYHRGWFSSDLDTVVEAPDKVSIDFHGKILHGPFVAFLNNDGQIAFDFVRMLMKFHFSIQVNGKTILPMSDPLFNGISKYHLFGGISGTFRSLRLHTKTNRYEIDWAGITGFSRANNDFSEMSSHITISPINARIFDKQLLSITSEPATLDATVKENSEQQFSSTMHFVLPSLNIKSGPITIAQIQHLSSRQEIIPDGNQLYKLRYLLGAETIRIAGVDVSPAQIEFQVDRINDSLRDQFSQFKYGRKPTPKETSDIIQNFLTRLAIDKATFSLVKLHISTPLGDIDGNAHATLVDVTQPSVKEPIGIPLFNGKYALAIPYKIAFQALYYIQMDQTLRRLPKNEVRKQIPLIANKLKHELQQDFATWQDKGIIKIQNQNIIFEGTIRRNSIQHEP